MIRGHFKGDYWTRVLAERGLESPGYHEAAEATRRHTEAKKLQQEEQQAKKRKKK